MQNIDYQSWYYNFLTKILTPRFSYEIGKLNLKSSYLQAFLIILLVFLLIFTFARLRHLYVHWSIGKPSLAFFFWGFFLALVLEGFLIIGGKTFLISLFGWEKAPKPIVTALDMGRNKFAQVLGIKDEKIILTGLDILEGYRLLENKEKDQVRQMICK